MFSIYKYKIQLREDRLVIHGIFESFYGLIRKIMPPGQNTQIASVKALFILGTFKLGLSFIFEYGSDIIWDSASFTIHPRFFF